ncbi:MAG: hypothetical protein EPO21_11670 [Chloroflexota bacterium]|nr:MAG: hypothetical protein EPO21_11670 [Chloroflexota bacterium]
MAILQALFAAIGRSLGKILNTAFGWATVLLFGKVPQNRQIYLSILAFGSVFWLVVLIGIAFPSAATFLLALVTVPGWVDRTWIRLAMTAAAIVLPAVMGVVSLLIVDPEERPQGMLDTARVVLRGYALTLGLAVTLLMLLVFAPIIKIQTLLRRWSSQHVPVIVEPKDYLSVVAEIQSALGNADWHTERHRESWMIRLPTTLVTFLAGGSLKSFIAERLVVLRSDKLEVALHPADMLVRGKESEVVHARATVAEQLAFSEAYLTWSKEANQLEDRIRSVWHTLETGTNASRHESVSMLGSIQRDMRSAKIEYTEWEVLFREMLLVERGVLRMMAGIAERPREPANAPPEKVDYSSIPSRPGRLRPLLLSAVVIIVALGALAWRESKAC